MSVFLFEFISTFYARRLKVDYAIYPVLNLQHYARVAPGLCPVGGSKGPPISALDMSSMLKFCLSESGHIYLDYRYPGGSGFIA